jgi:hypothetical protein
MKLSSALQLFLVFHANDPYAKAAVLSQGVQPYGIVLLDRVVTH